MNWEAIGAVGEILGALAVFVTLAYLAIQVRQNTAAVTTATYDSVMSGFNDLNGILVDNAEAASAFHRGTQDPSSLSETESIRYAFLVRSYSNQWLKLLRLREQGALSASEWRPFAEEAAQFFDLPGGRLFKAENQVFADLYTALEPYSGREISTIRFGDSEHGDA